MSAVTGPVGHGNPGSQAPVPVGGFAATSLPAAVDAGDAVNAYFDEQGRLHVIVDSGASGGTQYAEDAAHASGNTGTLALVVRRDAAVSSTATDGDYGVINTDKDGHLWVVQPEVLSLRDVDVDNTDQTLSATAGRLFGYHIYNPNGTDAFFQFYDAASATPGTTTPKLTLWVPAGGALEHEFSVPVKFATGMHYAATTTVTGGVDPTTGLIANLYYRS